MTKILIVDDHAEARTIIRLMVCKHATKLWEAENAAAALQMIKENRPDVVLFDIVMPGKINGFHACEMVKSDPALADVIVILIEEITHHKNYSDTFLLEKFR